MTYSNFYSQKRSALISLDAIKEICADIEITKSFDYSKIKNLIKKQNNLDLLLFATNSNFEGISDHLQEREQYNLAILFFVGNWVESLYLICEVAKKQPNELLNNRIGEQKLILDQLLLLLTFYEEDKDIERLIVDMVKLQEIYDSVKITYTYTDPIIKENGNILEVEGKTTTQVSITAKDLDDIASVMQGIRKKIIK